MRALDAGELFSGRARDDQVPLMDANEALAVLREFRPRLILMDIQLPRVDGLELTRRLKAEPATSDIIILAVTAYAMRGDHKKALAAGCDGSHDHTRQSMHRSHRGRFGRETISG